MFDLSTNRSKKKEKQRNYSLRKRGEIKAQKQTKLLTAARDNLEMELGISPVPKEAQNQGLTEFLAPFEDWDYKVQIQVSSQVPFSMNHIKENSRKVFLDIHPNTKLEVIAIDNDNKCILSIISYMSKRMHLVVAVKKNSKLVFALQPVGSVNLNSMAALYLYFPFRDLERLQWNSNNSCWTETPSPAKIRKLNQSNGKAHARYNLPNSATISYKGETWKISSIYGRNVSWMRIFPSTDFTWSFGSVELFY